MFSVAQVYATLLFGINRIPDWYIGLYFWYNFEMDKSTAIKLAGSGKKLADLLGITKGAVTNWKQIPKARIWQLKVIKPEWFK